MDNFKSPAPRGSQDRRSVLDRILDTPHLEHVVPRLQPDLLHRVIQSCGLEDCGELVVLATPAQPFYLDHNGRRDPGQRRPILRTNF